MIFTPNETPEAALIREIKEELDASIDIDGYITTVEYDYPNFHLSMRVYQCHLLNPHLELLEHENAKWVTREHLKEIEFLPADKSILDLI